MQPEMPGSTTGTDQCGGAARAVRRAACTGLHRRRTHRARRRHRDRRAGVRGRAAVRLGRRHRGRPLPAPSPATTRPRSATRPARSRGRTSCTRARARLWSADRDRRRRGRSTEPVEQPRYALLGVRPCDLRAIGDPGPGADRRAARGPGLRRPPRRQPSSSRSSAPSRAPPASARRWGPARHAGPGLRPRPDRAASTATATASWSRAGTPAGAEVLAALPHRPADDATVSHASRAPWSRGRDQMGRTMPAGGLPDLLAASRESPHWDDVASRCLTCGNCTMVCPTCFCTTTEDVTDLTGDHAERWRRWDSCFDLDFSYLHGGSVRTSGAGRYRQWISTSSAPGTTSSARPAASAAAGASPGARSASTSPRRWPRWPRCDRTRPDGGAS